MLGRIILTSWLAAIPAVAMANQRVDFDRHKDFSKYKTFTVEVGGLVRPDGSADEGNTLAENRLRSAVTHELLARGLEPADSGAGLIVRVSGRDTERVSYYTTSRPYYGYGYWNRRFGYWRRPFAYRYGYWGSPFYDEVLTRRYVEEALTVDVIDRATGELVYRAQVTGEVGKDLDKQAAKSVDRAFKKFPVKELKGEN